MSKVIFYSKALSNNINKFLELETSPNKIIMSLDDFIKNTHVKKSSHISIVSGLVAVLSVLDNETYIIAPYEDDLYLEFIKYVEHIKGIEYCIWKSESSPLETVLKNQIKSNVISEYSNDYVFSENDLSDMFDVLYIMSKETIKHCNEIKTNEPDKECVINVESIHSFLKESYDITKQFKVNLYIPQIKVEAWWDFFEVIKSFMNTNTSRKKYAMIETGDSVDFTVDSIKDIISKNKNITICECCDEYAVDMV